MLKYDIGVALGKRFKLKVLGTFANQSRKRNETF